MQYDCTIPVHSECWAFCSKAPSSSESGVPPAAEPKPVVRCAKRHPVPFAPRTAIHRVLVSAKLPSKLLKKAE